MSACEIVPGLYRHYKGGLYMVQGVATMATGKAEEPMVIYQNAEGDYWVRTLEDFCGEVVLPSGEVVQRFWRVGKHWPVR